MTDTVRSTTPTRAELLRWELFCVPAEMAGIAAGLYLGLGLNNWGAGGPILFATVALSTAARFWHYSGAGRQPAA